MKSFFYGVILALQFLTRIPVPMNVPWEKSVIKGALKSFSIVGLVIGGVLAISYDLMSGSLPEWMIALAVLSLWVFLTGGLHLDGLMDVADAIGSNASVDKKLAIMKDPQVGSFAVISFVFYILWKLALIYGLLVETSISSSLVISTLMIIPSCSRLTALILLFSLPTLKKEGLAYTWKAHLSKGDVAVAVLPLLIYLVFLPKFTFLLFAYLFYFFIVRSWIKKTFNGLNGDLLGATIEGGELWGLLVLWIYFSYGMG
ncbi:adenosylcobinamide-GDP ribazoletransferase [Bacillus sp. CGMCC 1.16607]|uniref:adenosylcobinamide-GDP ribazoletransferase n=1 Tax=Bacillus sp. CGMCC 1.16607 TaxID=3351842 RepID=UPI00362F7E06